MPGGIRGSGRKPAHTPACRVPAPGRMRDDDEDEGKGRMRDEQDISDWKAL